MKENIKFKSAKEIMALAGRAKSKIIPVEYAQTNPVPKLVDGKIVIQILYYPAYGPPNDRYYPLPTHCIWLDPETGKILKFWACSLEEIFINTEIPDVPGVRGDAGIPYEEFFQKKEHFFTISNSVWKAFAQGEALSSDTQKLVRAYRELFLDISIQEEAKYTVAGAPDFFKWLDEISKQQ